MNASPAVGGSEAILVIEDDGAVRMLMVRMLSRVGYDVRAAASAAEAFALLHSSNGPISLVLCDIVLPDLNGAQLVSRVQACSPGTRALFMSGHTNDALACDGTLRDEQSFLQKPFTPAALARKVREVLDA